MMRHRSSLSGSVLREIAAREGTDPADLPVPLYEAIDPDALDSLFRADGGRVTFTYYRYTVTVESDGTVTLEPRTGFGADH